MRAIAKEAEALTAYDHFDSPAAVENARDRMAGFERLNGVTFQSPYFTRRGYGQAAKFAFVVLSESESPSTARRATRRITKDFDLVGALKDELLAADAIGIPAGVRAEIVAAVIITVVWKASEAVPYWRGYFAKEGRQQNTRKCARLMYRDTVAAKLRSENLDSQIDLAVRGAAACIDRFAKGDKLYENAPKTMSDGDIERWRFEA